MPVRIQRVVPVAGASAAAVLGLALLAFLYATSPPLPQTDFVGRLTAGERWRPLVALVGMMSAVWGTSSVVGGHFQRRQLAQIDEGGAASVPATRRAAVQVVSRALIQREKRA